MSVFAMSLYVLIWPALSAVVLAVILAGTIRDVRSAKAEGRELV